MASSRPFSAESAFASAEKILSDLGLSVYSPKTHPKKAEAGYVSSGFDFLGCHISPGLVQPTKEKRSAAIKRVDNILSDARGKIRTFLGDTTKQLEPKSTVSGAISEVRNFIRGWSHAYRFCNDSILFKDMDSRISENVNRFATWSEREIAGQPASVGRRVRGVPLISDTPRISLDDVKRKVR